VEIYHLRSFVTVADSGGVSRAARHLHLAQPAVSQHLRVLERELGFVLFERTTQGMKLTDAGLALVGYARNVLRELTEFKTAVSGLVTDMSNRVSLAMTPSMAASLLPGILDFLKVSATKVQLVLFERPTEDSLALLASGSVLIAVVRDAGGSGFEMTPMFEEPLVLVTSQANEVLARTTQPTLADFRDQPFVFFRHTGQETLFQGAYTACLRAGFTPRTICEGAESESMGQIVSANIACGIAPLSVVRLWPADRMRILSVPTPSPRSTIYLARVADRTLPPVGERVVRSVLLAARKFDQVLALSESEWSIHVDAHTAACDGEARLVQNA
jgi:DNA-binding transcriptional LysR family regulator